MTTSMFYFRQSIAIDGYKIINPETFCANDLASTRSSKNPEASIMVNNLDGQRKIKDSSLLPSNLFIVFSQLEMNAGSIMQFANEYGLLGIGLWATTKEHQIDKNSYTLVSAEPLSDWYNEISEMQKAIELWQLYSSNNKSELRKIIKWEEYGDNKLRVVYSTNKSHWNILYSTQIHPHLLDQAPRGNLDLPVMRAIQEFINKKYTKYVSPKMIFSNNYQKLVHQIVPNNLLGFMWIQLAQAFEGGKPYRNCKLCGTPFMIKNERSKKRLFCTDSCKSKNYRNSKST